MISVSRTRHHPSAQAGWPRRHRASALGAHRSLCVRIAFAEAHAALHPQPYTGLRPIRRARFGCAILFIVNLNYVVSTMHHIGEPLPCVGGDEPWTRNSIRKGAVQRGVRAVHEWWTRGEVDDRSSCPPSLPPSRFAPTLGMRSGERAGRYVSTRGSCRSVC